MIAESVPCPGCSLYNGDSERDPCSFCEGSGAVTSAHAVTILRVAQLEAQIEILVGAGRPVLTDVLSGLWSEEQGGISGYGKNGTWHFQSTSLRVTGDQLNVLFAMTDLEPQAIESLGSCQTCIHSIGNPGGRRSERGYSQPCSGCMRPKMSNFKAIDPDAPLCGEERFFGQPNSDGSVLVSCDCPTGHKGKHGGVWASTATGRVDWYTRELGPPPYQGGEHIAITRGPLKGHTEVLGPDPCYERANTWFVRMRWTDDIEAHPSTTEIAPP